MTVTEESVHLTNCTRMTWKAQAGGSGRRREGRLGPSSPTHSVNGNMTAATLSRVNTSHNSVLNKTLMTFQGPEISTREGGGPRGEQNQVGSRTPSGPPSQPPSLLLPALPKELNKRSSAST